ncbi:MAG TPA: glycosyltransferase family 39 protein [Solirubrobacteraceae bacterium]|nr:glycosyltransferase family 39 protein [Solirubrobacteraceae bacterium]
MATTTIPRPPLAAAPTKPGRLRALVRGHAHDPAWARPLLIALLAATLIAYLIDLTSSGYSNSFYAAAVQAGTKSWKAFFFGSIDSSNFITVDKPPASLWVMELSGRVFGFSSASMLVPQVLEGLLSVALLAAAVKRWFGAGAGLLAGLALAVTPVAALMFRFNNPDALMVCLMTASAYCLVRALEGERARRWILGVGALLGFAFLAKMMEAFLVVPGFALVYLVAAPVGARRRLIDLLLGGAAMLAGCGWWVAIVELWPAGSRPMIDGSPDNSILNLIFGYNGFGRLSGGSGGGGGNFSGATGAFRLFNDLMGGQASWLLPAAGVVLVGGMAWRLRAPRTDRLRAALLLWGSWLVVSGAVFSFSSGVIHTYYTIELAPAIAALVGIGAALLWQRREILQARIGVALMIAVTAAWAVVMLQRSPTWDNWLTPLVIVTALAAIGGLLAPAQWRRRLSATIAVCAVTACLAGPVAYTAETLTTAHTGSVPSAGPTVSDARRGFGAGRGGGLGFPGAPGGSGAAPGGSSRAALAGGSGAALAGGGAMGGSAVSSALVAALKADATKYRWVAATSGSQNAASLELASGGEPVMAIGGFTGQGGNLSLAQFEQYAKAGDIHYYIASGGAAGGGFGASGLPTASVSSGSGSAAVGSAESSIASQFGTPSSSRSAASGAPGGEGFPGGSLHGGRGTRSSFPGSGRGASGATGAPGGAQSSQAITTWVEAHYKAVTIGGQTVYDLTQPKS